MMKKRHKRWVMFDISFFLLLLLFLYMTFSAYTKKNIDCIKKIDGSKKKDKVMEECCIS